MRERLTTFSSPTALVPRELTQLVYELLDAHDDTVRIAQEAAIEERWHTHLSYLRDLQRVGREILADATTP